MHPKWSTSLAMGGMVFVVRDLYPIYAVVYFPREPRHASATWIVCARRSSPTSVLFLHSAPPPATRRCPASSMASHAERVSSAPRPPNIINLHTNYQSIAWPLEGAAMGAAFVPTRPIGWVFDALLPRTCLKTPDPRPRWLRHGVAPGLSSRAWASHVGVRLGMPSLPLVGLGLVGPLGAGSASYDSILACHGLELKATSSRSPCPRPAGPPRTCRGWGS